MRKRAKGAVTEVRAQLPIRHLECGSLLPLSTGQLAGPPAAHAPRCVEASFDVQSGSKLPHSKYLRELPLLHTSDAGKSRK